jgi:hypothetical protein
MKTDYVLIKKIVLKKKIMNVLNVKKKYSWLNTCLNDLFGCVDTYAKNCLKYDDIFDFNSCTECLEGFTMNENGECV